MALFPCKTRSEKVTIDLLLGYFDIYQLSPEYIVGNQGFSGFGLEAFYNRKDIRFTALALEPETPWPKRAEAAVRLFKDQVKRTQQKVKWIPHIYEHGQHKNPNCSNKKQQQLLETRQ